MFLEEKKSVINVSERGFPFVKIGGFPNCPLGTSQIGNSFPKTSVIAVEYHSQDGPLEIFFLGTFLQAIFYPYPKECTLVISNKSTAI